MLFLNASLLSVGMRCFALVGCGCGCGCLGVRDRRREIDLAGSIARLVGLTVDFWLMDVVRSVILL